MARTLMRYCSDESVRGEVCEHLNISYAQVFAIPEAARASFRPTDACRSPPQLDTDLGCEEISCWQLGQSSRARICFPFSAFEELTRVQPDSELQLVIAGVTAGLSDRYLNSLEKSPVRIVFC